ncbi:MAG: energy transducer TonB [Parasphingopyxis sp.]|uniref:energy transducer TonB n=1 Tax=Parasphingopyxis sp. TaxID=1920299 RepID=UPI003F9EEA77
MPLGSIHSELRVHQSEDHSRAVSITTPASRVIVPHDYPTSGLRLGMLGEVEARLFIGQTGSVESCYVTATSGYARLDETVCRYVNRRGRFVPASDLQGDPTTGVVFITTCFWMSPEQALSRREAEQDRFAESISRLPSVPGAREEICPRLGPPADERRTD